MAEYGEGLDSMDDAFGEIEAAIRSAAGYVRASDDLRPRVLEIARTERGERRAQRSLRHAAAFFILLATFTTALRPHLDALPAFSQSPWLAASSSHLIGEAQSSAAHGGDFAWQLVESLTELRQRQAAALNYTP